MSQFEALRQELTNRFKTGFVDGPNPFVPVAYENAAFTQPATTWARFSIVEGDRDNLGIGNNETRTVGILYLQIFSAPDGGTKKAREAADKLADIFDNQTFAWNGNQNGVIMRRVSLQTIGKTQEGWYQQNASIPFWFDETPA